MPKDDATPLPTQTNTEGADGAGKDSSTPDSLIGGAPEGESAKNEGSQEGGTGESLIGDAKKDTDAGEEGKEDESAKPEGAPEKYDPFTFPEGVEPDEDLVKGFTPLAKDLGLSQAQAQKLVDFHAGQLKAIDAQMEQSLKTQIRDWQTEAKKDPESGKKLALCRKFVDHLKDPEVESAIYGSWLGSHPAIVKILATAGKLISEDTLLEGGQVPKKEKTPAQKMYPNMK